MSKFGDLDFDDRWYDEPLDKYLEYKKTEDEVSDDRYEDIVNVVVDSPENSDWKSWDEHTDWRDGMDVADAQSFKRQLEDDNLGSRTVDKYLSITQSFLAELFERKVVTSNPVAYVYEETDFEHDSKNKINRTIREIGSFLQAIPNLQQRAIGIGFSKTGIRLGENHNIDLPFVHLDHPIYYDTLDEHGISVHNQIANNPDTIYIPSEPTIGEVFRGEKRLLGNKRKRGTRIPIDAEFKRALLDWLAVRPETAYPHPLWVSQSSANRIGKTNPNRKLTDYWAEEAGLVDDGSTEEFTPHWFRHFFTTNMKPGRGYHDDSIDPTLVKYIRGDVEDDIMEVYTHDWGDQVREQYLDAIYQFGIYD
jgi:site-specific recombinase XerC